MNGKDKNSRKEIKAKLKSIEFNFKNNKSGKIDVTIDDSYEITGKDNGTFEVTITRKCNFKPQNIVKLSVSYLVTFSVENIDEKFDPDEVVKKMFADIEVAVMPKISLMIAEITKDFSDFPLITPPIFQKRKEA